MTWMKHYTSRCIMLDGRMRMVYMGFQHRDGWQRCFLKENLQTALTRRLCFATSAKIEETWQRFGKEDSYFLPADLTDVVGSAPVQVTSDVGP